MSDEIMETQAETETVAVETQESKTFTQDELDRIVADRVAREQRKFDKKRNQHPTSRKVAAAA